MRLWLKLESERDGTRVVPMRQRGGSRSWSKSRLKPELKRKVDETGDGVREVEEIATHEVQILWID